MFGQNGRGFTLFCRKIRLPERRCQQVEKDVFALVRPIVGGLALLLLGAAPGVAQPTPILLPCVPSDVDCFFAAEQIRREAQAVRRGDYEAMRNVAYCMETGCDKAVVPQPRQACAWRKRIIKNKLADVGDRLNLKICLDKGY